MIFDAALGKINEQEEKKYTFKFLFLHVTRIIARFLLYGFKLFYGLWT